MWFHFRWFAGCLLRVDVEWYCHTVRSFSAFVRMYSCCVSTTFLRKVFWLWVGCQRASMKRMKGLPTSELFRASKTWSETSGLFDVFISKTTLYGRSQRCRPCWCVWMLGAERQEESRRRWPALAGLICCFLRFLGPWEDHCKTCFCWCLWGLPTVGIKKWLSHVELPENDHNGIYLDLKNIYSIIDMPKFLNWLLSCLVADRSGCFPSAMAAYFGFGALMNKVSLRMRGVHPRSSHAARLPGFRLVFRGSHGMATVLPSEADDVYGVLHVVSEDEKKRLESTESSYEEIETEVQRLRNLIAAGLGVWSLFSPIMLSLFLSSSLQNNIFKEKSLEP